MSDRIPTMGDITDAQAVLVPLMRELTPFEGSAGKAGKAMADALQHVRDAVECLNKASEKLEARPTNIIEGGTIRNADGDVLVSADHPSLVKDERSDEKLKEVAEPTDLNDDKNVDEILENDKKRDEELEKERLEAEAKADAEPNAKHNKKNNK